MKYLLLTILFCVKKIFFLKQGFSLWSMVSGVHMIMYIDLCNDVFLCLACVFVKKFSKLILIKTFSTKFFYSS